jgi:hypothetical protein
MPAEIVGDVEIAHTGGQLLRGGEPRRRGNRDAERPPRHSLRKVHVHEIHLER